jgi:hypothetical protein
LPPESVRVKFVEGGGGFGRGGGTGTNNEPTGAAPLISQRTKKALAVKKASGVRLGRPPTMPQAVVRRIQRQRAPGDSLPKIADDLNEDRVPTAEGGVQWYAATARHVLLGTS